MTLPCNSSRGGHHRCLEGEAVRILVLGTYDTKATELRYVMGEIARCGGEPVLVDTSTSGSDTSASLDTDTSASLDTDIEVHSAAVVAAAAGTTLDHLRALERGQAVEVMRVGVKSLVMDLAGRGAVDGAICIGGAGAHLAGPAFQALDLGFPKLVVSPLASGSRTFEPYVGLRDVAVLHSVADIAGINAVSTRIYQSAAGYIVGAARAVRSAPAGAGFPVTVAVSMNGNTTPALQRAQAAVEARGWSFVAFHANGVGGRALEDFVRSGQVSAVLDYTTTELSACVLGGLMRPGADRMESAGVNGLPQVLVPGCVDFITVGPLADAERRFPGRRYFGHSPELTLVRLEPAEMAEVGALFAEKANRATGPTSIFVPMRGFSVPDREGGAFWDPDADRAFVDALERELSDSIRLTRVDAHINDEAFIEAVLSELIGWLERAQPRDGSGPARPPIPT